MRPVTEDFRREAYAQETDEAFLVLLTISHPELLDGPVRLVNNAVNVVSRGNVYLALPFSLHGPVEAQDQLPEATITIDNVERTLLARLRTLTSPLRLDIEIVRASDPDSVEASFPNFRLVQVGYDAKVLSGKLTYRVFSREPWPQHRITPGTFPGVF